MRENDNALSIISTYIPTILSFFLFLFFNFFSTAPEEDENLFITIKPQILLYKIVCTKFFWGKKQV